MTALFIPLTRRKVKESTQNVMQVGINYYYLFKWIYTIDRELGDSIKLWPAVPTENYRAEHK